MLQWIFTKTEFVKEKTLFIWDYIYELIKKFCVFCYDSWEEDPGAMLIIGSLLFGLCENNLPLYIGLGIVIYVVILIKRQYTNSDSKKIVENLDIDRFGTGDKSVSVILDQYIAECFSRDVLFLKGIKEKEYISEKEENIMLTTLLDSVTLNISPYMREKFDQYYGQGRTDIILARKCYVIVSIYAQRPARLA